MPRRRKKCSCRQGWRSEFHYWDFFLDCEQVIFTSYCINLFSSFMQEKAETEIKKFRQTLCFKARPMPDFYRPRESPINQIKGVKVSLSIMLPLSAALSEHTCRYYSVVFRIKFAYLTHVQEIFSHLFADTTDPTPVTQARKKVEFQHIARSSISASRGTLH